MKLELRFAQLRRAEQSPHLRLFCLCFQKGQSVLFTSEHACVLNILGLLWKCFAEMVHPAHAKIEAMHIMRLPRNGYGLLHCRDSLAVGAKVGLQNGQVQQSVLVETAISIVHGIVKVPMQIVEGGGIVSGAPGVEESAAVKRTVHFFRRRILLP